MRKNLAAMTLGALFALVGVAFTLMHAQPAQAAQATVTLPAATASGQPMSWTGTCSGITCTYNVYSFAGACPSTPAGSAGWNLLTATPISGTSFTDTTAVAGQLTCYAVEAVNGASNSAPLTGQTTVPPLPTAPTGLVF